MTERDVSGLLSALKEAIRSDNEEAGMAAIFELVGGALKDLSRIADALEILATKGAIQ